MYTLDQSLRFVKGVGPQLAGRLAEKGLSTVLDLLLWVPLRYEDRSQRFTIAEAPRNTLLTLQAEVVTASQYYKGRRNILNATIKDATGKLKAMWFNNPYLKSKLVAGETFLFSGTINDKGFFVQATVENVSDDTIHTDRLVPLYSSVPEMKTGSLRRILKELVDHLEPSQWEQLPELTSVKSSTIMPLTQAFAQIHFPDTEETATQARERIALEELLSVIDYSQHVKDQWQALHTAPALQIPSWPAPQPTNLPFQLTAGQVTSMQEIMADLQSTVPMNRILIGDVGSGKTVVAGAACHQVVANGYTAALIAPTQILATQHAATFAKLFPTLPLEILVGGRGSSKRTADTEQLPPGLRATSGPRVIIGTHAVLNKLHDLQPALVIFDEQHRFGVGHRSTPLTLAVGAEQHLTPHILTMSATPIPRSFMLTLFAHLNMSSLDELPAGRIPTTTWLIPTKKQTASYEWMLQELCKPAPQGAAATTKQLALVVCPFISPSKTPSFGGVAAATETYQTLTALCANHSNPAYHQLTIELLHGKLTAAQKEALTTKLFNNEIDILVTTPVIEVGLDVPTASIIIIEGAERFGLASLHQLRGRVGRAGQESYCLLHPTPDSTFDSKRLTYFTKQHSGLKLAEFDLQRRGAGDLFGTQQHGFDDLQFASWTNFELITLARQLYDQLSSSSGWQPLFKKEHRSSTAAN
jgi:ATP-dependent DNA helicase RecG